MSSPFARPWSLARFFSHREERIRKPIRRHARLHAEELEDRCAPSVASIPSRVAVTPPPWPGPVPASDVATITTLFGTGLDGNGNPLVPGAIDPHYALISAPSPDNPGPAYNVINNGFPFNGSWLPNDSQSQWIAPNANENDFNGGVSEPVGTYTYETTFDLTYFDPNHTVITGMLAGDNTVQQVLINGQDAGVPAGSNSDYDSMRPFSITSGFVQRINKLDFVVYNALSDWPNNLHNPSGLRVQLSGESIASVRLSNVANGSVQVNYAGALAPFTLGPNQTIDVGGNNFTITLLNNAATYQLYTNGTIGKESAAPGVYGVSLSVDTTQLLDKPALVGDGSIGEVDLPAGTSASAPSMLNVYDRGDLGSVAGPTGSGLVNTSAGTVSFQDLTGSITGLDQVNLLNANGYLGTSNAQTVAVNSGITALQAEGVGADVTADQLYDSGDTGETVTIGAGGIPGTMDLGNVSAMNVAGAINTVAMQVLSGLFFDSGSVIINSVAIASTSMVGAAVEAPNAQVVELSYGTGGNYVDKILAGFLKSVDVKSSLTVANEIVGTTGIGDIKVPAGALKVGKGIRTQEISGDGKGNIGLIQASLIETPSIACAGDIGEIRADVFKANTVFAAGTITLIEVEFDFTQIEATTIMVFATHNIQEVNVGGHLGGVNRNGTYASSGQMEAGSIGDVLAGDIDLNNIVSDNGDIKSVQLAVPVQIVGGEPVIHYDHATITANGGDVRSVVSGNQMGDIFAKETISPRETGNIWSVTAFTMPRYIIADNFIGTIKDTNPGPPFGRKVFDKVRVEAQGGAAFTENNIGVVTVTPAPLTIDLGAVFLPHLKVTLRYGNARIRVAFGDKEPLLVIKHSGGVTQTWIASKVNSPNNSVNLKNAVFTFDKKGMKYTVDLSTVVFTTLNGNKQDKNWTIVTQ